MIPLPPLLTGRLEPQLKQQARNCALMSEQALLDTCEAQHEPAHYSLYVLVTLREAHMMREQ